MEKKLWFKAKRYGWGWYPATWEGWFITILYVLFILRTFLIIDIDMNPTAGILFRISIPLILATVILFVVCYVKGEKPGWRWGKKDSLK